MSYKPDNYLLEELIESLSSINDPRDSCERPGNVDGAEGINNRFPKLPPDLTVGGFFPSGSHEVPFHLAI
jgi:hypothetical protein